MALVRGVLAGALCCLGALSALEKNDLIEAVTRLKTACGTPDFSKAPLIYASAAKLVAHSGSGHENGAKSPADYTRSGDQRVVHAVCERVNNRFGLIDAWGEMLTRQKRGQTWYAIEAQYTFRNRIKKGTLAFVEINGKLYLADID